MAIWNYHILFSLAFIHKYLFFVRKAEIKYKKIKNETQ